MRAGLIALSLLLFSLQLPAEQTVIADYASARQQYFWTQLYTGGGHTLYCDTPFSAGERHTIEHVYPADWIAEFFGCANRRECDNPHYRHAEADLHNLWPALGRINSSRGKLWFDELPGEEARRFIEICADYERGKGRGARVEPRDSVKGDIARSLFYMSEAYGLPLYGMEAMLLRWHRQDPVDDIERWRNQAIDAIQHTRNRWIDLVEESVN